MHILYIINAFSWGGAEKLVYDLALSIRPKVESVSIIALYKQENETERKMIQELNAHSIATMVLGKTTGKGRLKCVLVLNRYIKDNKVSIIHAHCSVPMLFGKIVGKMRNIPVICTIHNTRGYSARKETLTKWMTNKYVSIGQAAEEYMIKELKISAEQIQRIYNAIDTSAFKQHDRDNAFWEKYPGEKNEIKLLNVARVNEQKNQLCLLRAIKICKDRGVDAHVYILGAYDDNEPTYESLLKYIQENGITENVTFLGMKNNVNEFLQNADCFVMTSWYEGLSVAFLEAVACGTPIITTDMPFVRELMEIGKCATIIPQDDDNALAELIIHKSFYKADSGVIHTFQTRFSMETFCKQHLMLYRSFCKQ